MNIYRILITSAVLLAGSFLCDAFSAVDKDMIISRNGIQVVIPWRYTIGQEKLSNKASALIKIPEEDLRTLVPPGDPAPISFPILIYIVDSQDIESLDQSTNERSTDINMKTGIYSKEVIEKDASSNYFRVYNQYSDILGWIVIKHMPPILSGDIIGSCYKDKMATITVCRLSVFVADGVSIETSIRLENIIYYEAIKEYIASLVSSWRKQ